MHLLRMSTLDGTIQSVSASYRLLSQEVHDANKFFSFGTLQLNSLWLNSRTSIYGWIVLQLIESTGTNLTSNTITSKTTDDGMSSRKTIKVDYKTMGLMTKVVQSEVKLWQQVLQTAKPIRSGFSTRMLQARSRHSSEIARRLGENDVEKTNKFWLIFCRL